MRSPRKPGYVPLAPPTPAWVALPSDPLVSLIGGVGRVSGLTIADQHFANTTGNAVALREYDDVVIERCTFANVGNGINLQLCGNVTIRHCAFWNINPARTTNGHHVLANECDGVTVEDCWFYNDPATSGVADVVNYFLTDNGIVRRCRIMGSGTSASNAGIIVGDGPDVVNGGGDNLLVEDNLVIDGTITAIGTNNIVRRNVVLMRGLVSTQDGITAAIGVDSGSYPGNPIGPTTVTDNQCVSYNSNGGKDPFPVQVTSTVTVTGRATNPVTLLIDEYSRWNLTGYYGAP
jgi:hypothetical protein